MTDRLSRFTPNVAGLDRDAILFAAGRQSVRSVGIWKVLAGLLLASQFVTLFVLWPRSAEVAVPRSTPTVTPPVREVDPPSSSPPSNIWSVRSSPDSLQTGPTPAATEFVSSGPTLTVGSAHRFD
jgi:hypothetical protein